MDSTTIKSLAPDCFLPLASQLTNRPMICRSILLSLLSLKACFGFSIAPQNKFHGTQTLNNKFSRRIAFEKPTSPRTVVTTTISMSSTAVVAGTGAKVTKSALLWMIGSIIGGTTGTPIVIKATNQWYRKIPLPSFTPPDYVFGPIWTLLYSSIGYSAYKVYQIQEGRKAFWLLAAHYLLNLSWAPIFFGLKHLRAGLVISVGLVLSLLGTLPFLYNANPLSAYILVPYLCWLIFATKLNDAICKLNKTEGGYNNAKFYADLDRLQADAAKYAGL